MIYIPRKITPENLRQYIWWSDESDGEFAVPDDQLDAGALVTIQAYKGCGLAQEDFDAGLFPNEIFGLAPDSPDADFEKHGHPMETILFWGEPTRQRIWDWVLLKNVALGALVDWP
jgi:hypothetical protein